jgi:hypothetical protein
VIILNKSHQGKHRKKGGEEEMEGKEKGSYLRAVSGG